MAKFKKKRKIKKIPKPSCPFNGNDALIDYKDVSTNKFSNWEEGYLGMGTRKRNELRDYKIISDITSSKNREISSLMEALGFKTLKEEEIFK